MPSSHKEYVDICIIGGGIIGLSVAAALARQGLVIRLIDKQYVGSSRDNIGHVSLHGHPKGLHDFVTFCHGAWQRASYELDCELGLSPTGSLMLAQTDEEFARLQNDHNKAQEQGEESQWSEDISAISSALGAVTLPEDVKGVRLASQDMVIDTRIALENMRKMLIQQGVRIWGQDEVKNFLLGPTGAVRGVQTDSGDICMAEQTIVCTGVHTQQLVEPLGIHLPIRPARAHLLELSPSGNIPLPFMTKLFPRGVLRMRKTNSGRVLVAYDGLLEQNESVWERTMNPERLGWMRQQAATLLPCLQEASMQAERSVLQAVSPDFMPYIGPYAGKSGILFAVGMSGRSYAFAAGVAEIMAALACGKTPPVDIAPVRADRYHDAHPPHVNLADVLPTYMSEEEEEAAQGEEKPVAEKAKG